LKQGDCEFKAYLGYQQRLSKRTNKKKEKEKTEREKEKREKEKRKMVKVLAGGGSRLER
jgi:hypothetical protein